MKRPIIMLAFSGRRLLMVVFSVMFLILGLVWNNDDLQSTSEASQMAWQNLSEDELRERVEKLAKQYNAEPINAKNDPVWKGIPGLNGVQVDVEATLEKASRATAERISLVVKQIPPKVSLDDLGAVPIYRGNPEKKQMALMINVAWGTEYIQGMLDTLEKHNVKATFFLDGSWTAKNGDVAKSIVDRGHEIGNHAYTHPDMSKMGQQQTLREITRTNDVIKKATGSTPKMFAPPGGAFNDTTVKVAHGQGMNTILWTLDTIDWKKPPASTIENRVVGRAENGALVLMHPTEPTRDALRAMIPALLKKGYDLVTVSQLLDSTRPVPSS